MVEESDETFLYIKTTDPIALCREFVEVAEIYYPDEYSICRFVSGARFFRDGFIAMFHGYPEIELGVAPFKPVLDRATHWAAYQPQRRQVLEWPSAGPLSDFKWVTAGTSVHQFYLLASDDEPSFGTRMAAIQKALKRPSEIAFTFADGAVILVATNEPFKVPVNRSFRELAPLRDWLAVGEDDFGMVVENDYWSDGAAPDSQGRA